jgi:hypothetical protein
MRGTCARTQVELINPDEEGRVLVGSAWMLETEVDAIAETLTSAMLDEEWRERARAAGPKFTHDSYSIAKLTARVFAVIKDEWKQRVRRAGASSKGSLAF